MGYLSIYFVLFVFISLLVYYIIPKNKRWSVLLISSLFFYLSYDIRYFIFLAVVIVLTYYSARLIESHSKYRQWLMWITIFLIVFIWFCVKVYNWLGNTINRLMIHYKLSIQLPFLNVIVPLGISYFSLCAISYVIDVYRGKTKAETNILKYALYISYFPAIVQGPVSRYDQLHKELFEIHPFDFSRIISELLLILFGLIKKMVIADHLSVFVNYCFTNYLDIQGLTLYFGAIAYSIQLYMDFSGCVDICRGVSGLFGVRLINNFNAPYFSKSIKEFWQRWHISLSSWLKDYVYIPLGGNRKGKVRQYLNILATFMVSGIWHGAGFNFLAWGALHAFYQITSSLMYPIKRKIKQLAHIEENSISDHLVKSIITFNLVTIAWILFRSDGLQEGIKYILNMLKCFDPWVIFDGSLFNYGISLNMFKVILVNILIVFFAEYLHLKKGYNLRKSIQSFHISIRYCIYFLLIYDILFFGAYGLGYDVSAFLYGGF